MGIAPSETPASRVIATEEIHPGQFLQGQAEGEVVAPHAAVLLGERQPEQAELAHLGHDVVGELAALVVAADDRRDHVAGEPGDGVPQVLLLRRELVTDHRPTFAQPAANRPRPAVV